MEWRIRKLVMLHKNLLPRDDRDILYVSKKGEGMGIARIEDNMDASIQGLEDNIKKSKRRFITATKNLTDNIKISKAAINTNGEKYNCMVT